jgi:uncharacterized membrane protein HdeD (DUF308 family)
VVTNRLLFELDSIRSKWSWLLLLGILMATLGTIAIYILPAATIGTALIIGWLLVLSGIIEALHAFGVRRWRGVFLHLVAGGLGVLIGLLVVTHPLAGAVAWTLLFALFLAVIGLFRLAVAIRLKFPHWGWAAFDGIVTFGLGILVWAEWPWSGTWFLGLSVGISLVLRGWSYVMFAVAIRNLRLPVEVVRTA